MSSSSVSSFFNCLTLVLAHVVRRRNFWLGHIFLVWTHLFRLPGQSSAPCVSLGRTENYIVRGLVYQPGCSFIIQSCRGGTSTWYKYSVSIVRVEGAQLTLRGLALMFWFGLVFQKSTGLRSPNSPSTCLSTVVPAPGCKSCHPCTGKRTRLVNELFTNEPHSALSSVPLSGCRACCCACTTLLATCREHYHATSATEGASVRARVNGVRFS